MFPPVQGLSEEIKDEEEFPTECETDSLIAKEDLSSITEENNSDNSTQLTVASDKSALTYKKLSDRVFFWTTVFLHITSLTIAMLVEDIRTVINFSGAIGSSSLMFLFPGLAFILALR